MGMTGSSMSKKYQPIHGEDIDSQPCDALRFSDFEIDRKSHFRRVAPWIASTLLLSFTTGYLLFQQIYSHPAYPSAFQTDLLDAHPYVSYEERVFSGKLAFSKERGTVYRDIDPSEPQYFGPPSPEIDDAWMNLLRGEFVTMTEEEAAPYAPDLNKSPFSDDYHFEPDMFHSLHCLNAIRMDLDKAYYSIHHNHHHEELEEAIKNSTMFPHDWDRIHRDHCLDQLRQAIQCHGDLSPVPLYHYNDDPIGLGVGQVHTCRKWEPMRKWMDLRGAN